MVCFPLMVCYMIYSIIYNEHKGWYSFCLQSAYGFLLTFGFIAMTPQLFINYKVQKLILYTVYNIRDIYNDNLTTISVHLWSVSGRGSYTRAFICTQVNKQDIFS